MKLKIIVLNIFPFFHKFCSKFSQCNFSNKEHFKNDLIKIKSTFNLLPKTIPIIEDPNTSNIHDKKRKKMKHLST